MKKFTAVLLICAVLSSCAIVTSAAGFPDVQSSNWDWARTTIEKLTDLKILKGYEDGTFRPDRSVTNEEAFTLFARSIGIEQTINEGAVEAARAQNAQTEAKYNTFAVKELSFMLYRKILAAGELDKYLAADRKELPMLRHEAAILITKVMGGEQEVMSKISYVMDYTDSAQIPIGSKGYVEYVTNRGIMQGMDDGSFSPMTTVTRAQICMMLDRTMNVMDLQYVEGTILAVDNDSKQISYSNNSGTFIKPVLQNATFNIDAKSSVFIDLKPGMNVVVTLSKQGVWAVDATTAAITPPPTSPPPPTVPDSEVSGVYSGTINDSRGTFIKVYDRNIGTSSTKQYLVDVNTKYTYNGLASTIANLNAGDAIDVKLAGDTALEVSARPRMASITDAELVAVVLEPKVSIKISHSSPSYNGMVLPVSDLVYVGRNGATSKLSALIPGDKLEIKLDYDEVTEISAKSTRNTVEGAITSFNIGQDQDSAITLDIGGKTETYTLMRDTTVTLDGESASIYDLRLGFRVTLSIDSGAVRSISVKSVSGTFAISGTVDKVNVSNDFIVVNVVDPVTGAASQKYVFVKVTTTIMSNYNGQKLQLKDIKPGHEVMVSGSENMGAFEASAIMVITDR